MPETLRYSDEDLRGMTYALHKKLRTEGKVTDAEIGHLFLPWITDSIDLKLQRYAARLIANELHRYHPDPFTGVVGIPTMGTFLATTLAEEMEIPLLVSRKGAFVPSTWEYPVVVANKPYSNGVPAYHAYNIPPGAEMLLVDDVLSEGTTIIPIIDAYRDQGAIVDVVAVYVNKLFRPGNQLLRERRVQTIAAYNIEAVRSDGTLVVVPPGITGGTHVQAERVLY
ncbi:hypothetical protein A2875_01970 [Candidatus Gottesmanbacteria bacterium RIFCSPHIGHO2_01_FULL_46_14]|uniref:Phosphoribosyltransferase domain-containing protein n=1 Tax=Candidatus Gottesmanbacteria bacterium RIFCSPHIGHO2_01_FULL_46_14 TaxID=1798380 RepID=A0A1F5ZPG4_9BACT|nr:MAG: hypothetical protein A2875_01970 [Candidatus Gottesmanbacteria bacterium RIFCSPHIGHO2_01_FULL_46_14]